MPRDGYKAVTIRDCDYEALQAILEEDESDNIPQFIRKAILMANNTYRVLEDAVEEDIEKASP